MTAKGLFRHTYIENGQIKCFFSFFWRGSESIYNSEIFWKSLLATYKFLNGLSYLRNILSISQLHLKYILGILQAYHGYRCFRKKCALVFLPLLGFLDPSKSGFVHFSTAHLVQNPKIKISWLINKAVAWYHLMTW